MILKKKYWKGTNLNQDKLTDIIKEIELIISVLRPYEAKEIQKELNKLK